jgi:hypothetical protein
MKKDVLTRPFPQELVKQRQGQNGKVLSYLETRTVIERLNEACDAWSFEVVQHEVHDNEVVVVGKLVADGVIKMAFGGSGITLTREGEVVSLADDLKAAASDALKKAASLLGVGLEFYGSPRAEQPRREQRPVQREGHPAEQRQGEEHVEQPRAEPVDDRLTSRQLAALHAVCRRKGWPTSSLEALCDERYRKVPQTLTRREASSLISELSGSNGH